MDLEIEQRIGRFKIVAPLGSGGQGSTYLAEDTKTGDSVALKSLTLADADAWKSIELFEREASVLSSIEHDSVPDYIDYIANDDGFFLVQELVSGDSLYEAVNGNRRFGEEQVLSIAETLLEVLKYLHSLNPPIIHRDIKPQNVILNDDGEAKLVDFGAVKNAIKNTYASTMVGTFGYMAPEQYQGESDERSDLYALGATLVFLVTGKEPHQLPKKRLKIDFESHANISPEFAAWLGLMIEPAPEDRFNSSGEALEALRNRLEADREDPESEPLFDPFADHESAWGTPVNFFAGAGNAESSLPKPPTGSDVIVEDRGDSLAITIPTASAKKIAFPFVFMLLFSVFWMTFLGFWTVMALNAGLFAAFSIPFWIVGFYMVFRTLRIGFGSEEIVIKKDRFTFERSLFGWNYSNKHNGAIDDVELRTHSRQKTPAGAMTYVGVDCGVDSYHVGTRLSEPEKKWLVTLIQAFLSRPQSKMKSAGEVELDFDSDEIVLDVEEVEEETAQIRSTR